MTTVVTGKVAQFSPDDYVITAICHAIHDAQDVMSTLPGAGSVLVRSKHGKCLPPGPLDVEKILQHSGRPL